MAMPIWRLCSLVIALVVAADAGRAAIQEGKQPDEPDLNNVSMEISALQALAAFRMTDDQMQKLQEWAKETAAKPRKREPAKASKEYRAKLMELHTALLEANDNIGDLSEDLDDLRKNDNPMLDDGVEFTDAARERAPQALRLLKVHQVTEYSTNVAGELFDPVDRLLDSLPVIRDLQGDAWKQRRQEISDEIVRLAAGVDAKRASKLGDQIDILLTRAHRMSAADFKNKLPELESSGRKLLGKVGPLDVLRNEIEYALAELLSNPRLSAVLEKRLKKAQ